MVTIADVAAAANVGAGTVSRVLNDNPHVSAATRARVLAAIKRLDYRPNPLARGLSRGRCQTIGVIIPSFTQASAVQRLRGVVAALDGSRYDLVLFNVETPLHRDEHFASLTQRARADGLVVMSLPPRPRALARLVTAQMPVVLVDTEGRGVPAIVTDDVEGGRIATRHLVSLGHRRIGFIGDDPANPFGFMSSPQREAGYREVVTEAGIEPLVRHGPHDPAVGQRIGAELLGLRPRPTAVFAASDVLAVGVLEAARVAGLGVPAELSVVGFDDIEISRYVGLTTVRQPLFDSGFLGARTLLDVLERGEQPVPRVRELPLELVVRSTTAAVPMRRSSTTRARDGPRVGTYGTVRTVSGRRSSR